MDLGLDGRVAIVTGASGGIGERVAATFLAEGASVVACARRPDVLEQAAARLRAGPENTARVLAVPTDTTDTASVQAMVDTVLAELGRVDVLVNSAAAPGGLVGGDVERASEDDLQADLDTKVMGYFRCIKAVSVPMKAARFGRIVNIGGLSGRGSGAISGMRNLALVHLSKVVADDLGPFGITANTVHPGATASPYLDRFFEREAARHGITVTQAEERMAADTPIRRIVSPDDIARVVCFLASPRSDAVTGESIAVDGGRSRGVYL